MLTNATRHQALKNLGVGSNPGKVTPATLQERLMGSMKLAMHIVATNGCDTAHAFAIAL